MKLSLLTVAGLALALSSVSAIAAPVVNGTISGSDAYGPALAVQTTQTQFGDNQSEWNAAYGTISGGRLYLGFTGNVEANFNKFDIFIDSKAGGQSVFNSSGNDNSAAMDGMTFDTGFTADYHVIARRGSNNGNRFDLDFANLGAQSASGYFDLFGNGLVGVGATGTGVNPSPIGVAYDNSNILGVTGGTGAADQTAALAVTTGLELSIDLADLGYVSGPIRIFAFQNNGDHNFASNQLLPGLVTPQGNLGGDGNGTFTGSLSGLNFNTLYPGAAEGWFTIVPAPGAASLLGIATLLAARRRR
jgi:hypothetical protein